MTPIDDISYRHFAQGEADLLAEFSPPRTAPTHGSGTPDAAEVREQAAAK